MPEFQCPSFPTWDKACNDNKLRKICSKPNGETYSICGSTCPETTSKPALNLIWKYQNNVARTGPVNSALDFDTPYKGIIANDNYPKVKLTPVITLANQTGTATNFGTAGTACFDITVENPSDFLGATGFILTVEWCKFGVSLKSLNTLGLTKIDTDRSNRSGFKIISNMQTAFMRYVNYDVGSFCLNVNINGKTGFNANTVKVGIDGYTVPLFCQLGVNCKVFCGNGVCDGGESSTLCPVDCGTTTCPASRRLSFLEKSN